MKWAFIIAGFTRRWGRDTEGSVPAVKKAAQATPNRRLRQEREQRCWSQLEVADLIRTTSHNVSRWERGITFPTPHFRQQLCTLFGKSAGELGLLQGETTDSYQPPLTSLSPPDKRTLSPSAQTTRVAEERRLVTILFADVAESTALGEALDPEDVRALMDRYYAHARRIIAHHGGTLEKFIGDAVMAIFGLPRALGDDAERALAAALALREAVTTDSLLGEHLVLCIGVNTGEVVANNDPSGGDFLVTGDAVNVAARLQQAASSGEIIVSERAATSARNTFLFGDLRLIEVKGKRQPLPVFPLSQVLPIRNIGRPPLVGRRQDILQLDLLRMRTLEERRPHLVSIVAPAGTGKSRLLEEFLAHLDQADGFQTAVARGLPYGQTLTYWPLRGLLTGLLESEEIDRPQVVDAFVQGGQTSEDAERLADFVLTSLGIEQEEVADRESIYAAWRLLIEGLARLAPRIVVFEDLHWASESLLELVEHLMHARVQAALLILALSRPELLDRRSTWGGGQQNYSSLVLQPLSEAQTRELVEQVATGLDHGLRERVVERSGGNPFFVLELVRGLAEKSTSTDKLPDTVHAAVLARLDLLSLQERSVVQAASIARRVFRVAELQAMLGGLTSNEIDRALDGLMRRHLVMQVAGRAFTFQHILIRDVANGTLSRAERVRMHSKIAMWLEEFASGELDEFSELIAYHFREAVRLAQQSAVPLELPIDLARVIHAFERAGLSVSRTGALAEARTYLQDAIDLAPKEEHLRLYEELGDALLQGHTAVDAYREAIEYWRKTVELDPLVGARLLRKLLVACTRWNIWDVQARLTQEELDGLLAEGQRLADAANDEGERWQVRLAGIRLLAWGDNSTLQEAEEGRSTALAAALYFEEQNDWVSLSEALNGYTVLSYRVGADDDEHEASQRLLSVSDLPLVVRADALQLMAATLFNRGSYSRCLEIVRKALTELRPGEPVVHLDAAIALATWAILYSGRWSEISYFIPTLKDIWEQVQQGVGANTHVAGGYVCTLHIALAREDAAGAESAFSVLDQCFSSEQVNAQALLTAYREDDPHYLAFDPSSDEWTVPMLMFLTDRGISAPPKLIARLRALISVMQTDHLIRLVEIAEALAREDDTRLSIAVEEEEAHGLIAQAARMRIVLAQRTGDRSQLERARPMLEQIGDQQFIRRLEKVTIELNTKADQRLTF
jgi:class 3 adenylate cyclase/tetratricopeptide (TPR) repeat protein